MAYLSDIEIAQNAKPLPIREIASSLGLTDEDIIPYGHESNALSPDFCIGIINHKFSTCTASPCQVIKKSPYLCVC